MTAADITNVEVAAPAHGVTLSETAAAKARGLLERDGSADMVLRIAVQPGGFPSVQFRICNSGLARQWKESPQAQEFCALGLSIVKPCFSIVSTKSMLAPSR